jgi:hypothetical protein
LGTEGNVHDEVPSISSQVEELPERQTERDRHVDDDREGYSEVQGRENRSRKSRSRENRTREGAKLELGSVQVNEESFERKSKSEGQLLEDTDTGRANVNFGPCFTRGEAWSVSPSNDDPPAASSQAEGNDLSFIDGDLGAISSSVGTRGVIQEEVLREVAADQGISEDFERGRDRYSEKSPRDSNEESISEGLERERRDLTEQRQSIDYSDNQEGNSRSAISKSEGQLLEDVKAGEPLLTSALISTMGDLF